MPDLPVFGGRRWREVSVGVFGFHPGLSRELSVGGGSRVQLSGSVARFCTLRGSPAPRDRDSAADGGVSSLLPTGGLRRYPRARQLVLIVPRNRDF